MSFPLPSEMLTACARNFPDKTAYVCGDSSRTWQEIDQRASRLASALQDLGADAGSTVAILGRESLTVYEHFFACMKLGAVRLSLNWRYSSEELGHLLGDSQASVLLIEAACVHLLESRFPQLAAQGVVVIGYGSGHRQQIDYDSLLESAPPLLPPTTLGLDAPLMLTYTSGTTGRPKGVVHSNRSVAGMIVQSLLARGLSPDDIWSTAASSSWMTVVLNMLGLGNGMTHVIPDGVFEVRRFLADVERWRVTAVMLVPTLIQRAIQEVQAGSFDLSSLRLLMYGSSPATPQLIRAAYETFDCELIQSYGMTEAGWITQLGAADHRRAVSHQPALLRSVGRPGVMCEVSIRDEQGHAQAPFVTGDIWIRSGSLMSCYLNRVQETEQALRGGWLITNDVGYLDDRGYLYLTDRKKFLIISGAVNIFPSGIEAALESHPMVGEVAVVGAPHPEWGEAVVAVVKLRQGSPAEARLLLDQHCETLVNRMERPKHYVFVDDFPRSVNGKLLKHEIKSWVAANSNDLPWHAATTKETTT